MSKPKVWLVDFPTHQYKEDIKELAAKNNLQIIDSKFKGDVSGEVEDKPPKLTKLKK